MGIINQLKSEHNQSIHNSHTYEKTLTTEKDDLKKKLKIANTERDDLFNINEQLVQSN